MSVRLTSYRARIEAYLEGLFRLELPQKRLLEAMRYSLLAGGKRVRPELTLAFCEAAGGDTEAALPAACALELLHTYSLIHDDLPCMDDDDLRRGKPTSHTVFGEYAAVLAGDALQAEAFGLLLSAPLPPERLAEMGRALARAAGAEGICGGQILDMDGEGRTLTLPELEAIHAGKTASLLRACCRIGVLAAGGTETQLAAADTYGEAAGMAFQIADDLLDATASTDALGKTAGKDASHGKSTYYALLGPEGCRRRIGEYTDRAVRAAEGAFSDPEPLILLAHMLAERKY